MEYSVISVVGPDSIGIMETIAEAVVGQGSNIEETRASILGGEFAVIMLVSGTAGSCKALKASLPSALAGKGMTTSVRPTVLPTHGVGIPYVVESLSLDTPGIVRAVTAVLLALSLNIENLECTVAAAPLSGSPMFKMRITVSIAPGTKLAALKAELSKAAEAHDLDISVRPLRSADRDLE
jgi:glycine cleavage system transcriptional repressor